MAFDVGSVTAKIDADISGFKKGIQEAQDSTHKFGETLKKIGGNIVDFGKQAAIFTGIATAGVVAFGKSSVDSFNESQKELAQLNAVLKSTGGIAGVTKEEVIGLATALQKQTTFSDEAVMSAENLLLTFTGIGKETFPEATKTVLDMSIALGQDTKSSAIQLGKALQDPILGVTALRRVGVNFNESQQKLIKTMVDSGRTLEAQRYILKELSTEFGGSATAQAETFAGKIEKLKNQFDDFKESVGAVIVSLANFAVSGDKGAFLNAIKQFIPDEATANQIVNFFEGLRNALINIGKWISSNQETVITFLKGFGIGVSALLVIGTVTGLIMALTNPLVILVAVITALYYAWETNFLGIRDITKQVIDQVMGFFNDYLKPAIEAFVNFWKDRWEFVTLITSGAWQMIKGIIEVAWNIIYGLIKVGLALMSGDWGKAWDAVKQLTEGAWKGLKDIFNGAIDFIKGWGGMIVKNMVQPFEDAWNKIKEYAEKIKDKMDFTKRNSPSVVDIVNKGVYEVNKALSGLEDGFNITPQLAGSTVSNSTVGPSINQIRVDMSGAVIADEYSADRIGEIIGDSIIKKLQLNVRF